MCMLTGKVEMCQETPVPSLSSPVYIPEYFTEFMASQHLFGSANFNVSVSFAVFALLCVHAYIHA